MGLFSEILPLNEAVVEMVRAAREDGRPTVLVSAADHRQVTAVANATGLFDEAYGSAEGRNLKGQTKADFLTDRFGTFDYVGDSSADLAVWGAARRAITVQAGRDLRQAAASANVQVSHIDPPTADEKRCSQRSDRTNGQKTCWCWCPFWPPTI